MQMIAPRDIYELADTVDAEQLVQEGADLEQVKQWVLVFVNLFFNAEHVLYHYISVWLDYGPQQDWPTTRQVTSRSPWVAAYLRSPRMVEERKELFLYVVICSALLRYFQYVASVV